MTKVLWFETDIYDIVLDADDEDSAHLALCLMLDEFSFFHVV